MSPVHPRYEVVIGLEVHVHLKTESKLFSPAPVRYGDPPNHDVHPLCLGAARRASRAQCPRGGVRRSRRARHPLHRASALDLRAQELLLSGPAEGLPDLAVRGSHLHRRLARDRARRRRRAADAAHRPHAHPHGGGCRQVDPRRGGDARRGDPRRPEPRRRAAAGDRLRARPALAGRGLRLPADAALHPAEHRRQRRGHGEGAVPLRRQRLAAAARLRRARHPQRDQEPQLLPLRRAGPRDRDHAAGPRARRGGRDPAGHAALRSGGEPHAGDAHQGERRRLPLLPRSRSGAAGPRSRRDRAHPPGAAGAARPQARALRGRVRALGLRCAAALGRPHGGGLLRGGSARPRHAEERRQLDPARRDAAAEGEGGGPRRHAAHGRRSRRADRAGGCRERHRPRARASWSRS